MKLSKKRIKELLPKIEKEARKVLVFESLEYLETNEFTIPSRSVYHVFGAYNAHCSCMHRVVYSPLTKSIQFRCPTVSYKG